jgi:hypothetical protein
MPADAPSPPKNFAVDIYRYISITPTPAPDKTTRIGN